MKDHTHDLLYIIIMGILAYVIINFLNFNVLYKKQSKIIQKQQKEIVKLKHSINNVEKIVGCNKGRYIYRVFFNENSLPVYITGDKLNIINQLKIKFPHK